MSVVLVDNGNGFTYSLAELFIKKSQQVTIVSNSIPLKNFDGILKKEKTRLVVFAPGTEDAMDQQNYRSIITTYSRTYPMLGIGVGMHQLVMAFGGRVERASYAVFGKTCKVHHDGKSIFKKLPIPVTAGRYNSLTTLSVPMDFEVSARDENNAIMGIRHKSLRIEGIQFHPESILTPSGSMIIDNALSELAK